MKDFFAKPIVNLGDDETKGKAGHYAFHLVALLYIVYSAYHGIHAVGMFHSGIGVVAGYLGIVALETFLAGLYMSFFAKKITDNEQLVAAGVTGGLAALMTLLAIVIDSNLTAGNELTIWMTTYLQYGLPVSPFVAALGAWVVAALSPEEKFKRSVANKEVAQKKQRYDAHIMNMDAELNVEKAIQNTTLLAKTDLAKRLSEEYQSDVHQEAIRKQAELDIHAMLEEAGIKTSRPRLKPVVDVPYETKNGTAPKLNGIPKN